MTMIVTKEVTKSYVFPDGQKQMKTVCDTREIPIEGEDNKKPSNEMDPFLAMQMG